MFDIKFLRENPDVVKENIKRKGKKDRLKIVDEVLSLDKEWRVLKAQVDTIRASRNTLSRAIADAKKSGKDAKKLLKEAGEIPGKIEHLEKEMYSLEEKLSEMLSKSPGMAQWSRIGL